MWKEGLIPAKEAAKQLGISRATLSRLVRQQRIGVYRINSLTLFDQNSLDAFRRSIYRAPHKTEALRGRGMRLA